MESWGCFPHERQRLYQTIEETRAEGVVILSGDVHFSEISRTGNGPYPLYDFTSSGLTNSHAGWAASVNNFRVSNVAYAEPTFGLLQFDWDAPMPSLTIEARGLDGKPALGMKISRDELKIRD
jgi:alkaline phosphatase D